MKRLCVFLALIAFVGLNFLHAQTVQITGTVTSAEDGMPIPGASVQVKGTTIGTSSDADGKYSLGVPQTATTLVFSFVGIATTEVEIAGRTVIDVALESEFVTLEEIVVTALGISREKKALGYSIQEVQGDDIKQVGQTNVLNSLTGKIAGVQITGSSGNTGGSANIVIRGIASVTGNNSPLFVVDGVAIDNSSYHSADAARGAGGVDFGNMAQDINPDDVESISVLKGAAASALYGSRALNGVVLITTKKGKAQKGLGVTFNSGVTFENVAYSPAHQKVYGGGSIASGATSLDGFETAEINGTIYRIPDFALDESWGPKYDPNILVLAWNSFDEWDSKNYLVPKPWVYPDNNHLSMFDTGISYTNSVAVVGGNEMGDFRLSYTNMSIDGYTPNNNITRNAVNFNGTGKFSKYLEAFTTFNYVRTWGKGRPEHGYGDHNPVMRMNQWGQNQLDYKEMSEYKNPDGTQRTWNRTSWSNPTPVYSDNPYWSYFENYPEDLRNRVYGNIGFSLNLFSWLKFRTRINMDHYNFNAETRVAVGSQAESGYTINQRVRTEMNYEGMFLIDKNITDDITLNAMLGANRMEYEFSRTGGYTQGGLLLSNWYHLSNSVVTAVPYYYLENKRVNSTFGSLTLGYRSMIYVDATFRTDWTSALGEGNNQYSYPSITTSFIFSELGALKGNNLLSFGKVRLNYAEVGGDTDPYRTAVAYNSNTNFGSNPNYSLPGTLNNPTLRPERSYSYEAGLELMFLQNRIGLDFTYYNTETEDQIIDVATSATTGYTRQLINAGLVVNKGFEVLLSGTPLKNWNGLTWDITLNYAKNDNMIVELAPDVETYRLTALFGAEIHAEEGQKYGTIRANDFVYDDDGNIIVQAGGANTGRYLNGPMASLGSYLPDWNAGIVNTFSYKGVDMMVQVDMQKGGKAFSLTHMWGVYSGILEKTGETNDNGKNIRDDVSEGGGVLNTGVYGRLDSEGNVVYTNANGEDSDIPIANTTYIDASTWAADHYSRARGPQNIFATDYIKLREIRIGYTIPSKFTGPVSNVKLSAFGRNLAIWGRADGVDWDPEYVHTAGNIQGIEGGALPSLRTFGLNLSLNF